MQPPGGGPNLGIEALACQATGEAGRWLASWRIQNLERQAVEILSTWLPHDKFASPRREFGPPLRLPGNDSLDLEVPVACEEAPGSVVENAFLILQVLWRRRSWRVLARQLVSVDSGGSLQHRCETVTVQPVGFSSQSGLGHSQGR